MTTKGAQKPTSEERHTNSLKERARARIATSSKELISSIVSLASFSATMGYMVTIAVHNNAMLHAATTGAFEKPNMGIIIGGAALIMVSGATAAYYGSKRGK